LINKRAVYGELANQLASLIEGEPDRVANTANMAALIYHGLPELNWAGFYFACPHPSLPRERGSPRTAARQGGRSGGREGARELVLGPFQGKPACVRIAWGKGVCGTAAARGTAIIVPDVNAFPGHIACDAASRSELAVPLVVAGRVVGVFDLDSPRPARFDDEDRAGCERLIAVLVAHHPDWR
jgi:L-methionine (R)-S-oxide reductase